jgi:ABC-type branched-subunit amino acid transport system ATPase component
MLSVRGLRSGYGNFEVLNGIDLEVGEGRIVALLGHNGAGKSTLLKAIFGLLPARAGSIGFAGRDATHAKPFDKAAMGMRLVPQEGNVFPNLSVEDNLRLGAIKLEGDGAVLARRIEEIHRLFPILKDRREQKARVLSGGERQMLAVSIALMTDPKMLLLDEPSSGLAPLAVGRLFEMIGQIRRELGKTVLLVEQNVTAALAVSDSVYVLQEGSIVFQGPSSDKEQIIRRLWRLADSPAAPPG